MSSSESSASDLSSYVGDFGEIEGSLQPNQFEPAPGARSAVKQ
jgi:hypothetical protein